MVRASKPDYIHPGSDAAGRLGLGLPRRSFLRSRTAGSGPQAAARYCGRLNTTRRASLTVNRQSGLQLNLNRIFFLACQGFRYYFWKVCAQRSDELDGYFGVCLIDRPERYPRKERINVGFVGNLISPLPNPL